MFHGLGKVLAVPNLFLPPSTPYTIPAGYHNGSGVVTGSGNIPSDTLIVYDHTSAASLTSQTIPASKNVSSYGLDILNFEGTNYTTITISALQSGFKAFKLSAGVITDVTALTIDVSDHPVIFLSLTGGQGYTYTIT